jgi:hypothetical protein
MKIFFELLLKTVDFSAVFEYHVIGSLRPIQEGGAGHGNIKYS